MALQDKKIMPPPWLAHREIERYSIGWRMGYGEDYIDRFGDRRSGRNTAPSFPSL